MDAVERKKRKRKSDLCFGLFVAGGIAGLIQLSHPIPFGDGFEMVAAARNLAAHGVLANPFLAAKTGATAVNPPAYPFLLAMLMKLVGGPSTLALVVIVLNIVANASLAALLPRVSLLLFGRIAPGAAAGALWLAGAQLMPSWDASYTALGLILFCLLSARTIAGPRPLASGAAAGALAGVLLLMNPSVLAIMAPWALFLAVRPRLASVGCPPLPGADVLTGNFQKVDDGVGRGSAGLRHQAQYMGALIVVASLLPLGWVARNYYRLGALTLRTNLGMTLYASLNDCAEPSLIETERNGCYQAYHPNVNLAEALLVRKLGEPEYDRMRIEDAMNWARTHPKRLFRLTAARFLDFWFPPLSEQPYYSGALWLITALSIPGLLLMNRRSEPARFFLLIALFLYPIAYYFVVTDVRYRYPVLWLSSLPAGYLCSEIVALAGRRIRSAATAAPHGATT